MPIQTRIFRRIPIFQYSKTQSADHIIRGRSKQRINQKQKADFIRDIERLHIRFFESRSVGNLEKIKQTNVSEITETQKQSQANKSSATQLQPNIVENLALLKEETQKLHQQKFLQKEERAKLLESSQYQLLMKQLEKALFHKKKIQFLWEGVDLEYLSEIFTEVRQVFEANKINREEGILFQDKYLNLLQSIEESNSQSKIEKFFAKNQVMIQQKKNQKKSSAKSKKLAKRDKQDANASKLLFIVGNTLLIRDYILNELKSNHNLIIQRISMTQKRNAQTFKYSIFEGTQSTVQYQQNGTNSNSIFDAFFGKFNSQNIAKTQQSLNQPLNNSSLSQQGGTQQQFSQKILFFEDIDVAFYDESEFFTQLHKIMQITKVPIIMTASNMDLVKNLFLSNLKDQDITYDLVKYKYCRPRGKEYVCYLKLIQIFEYFVNQTLDQNIQEMNDDRIKKLVESFKMTQLEKINDNVTQLFINHKRDISQLLNELQLNLHVSKDKKLTTDISKQIPSKIKKSEHKQQEEIDIESYATLMDMTSFDLIINDRIV
ncbi:UNKNOWN [Stylonychia lemnae]|uniref:Uncharacterized protein n=1 Tax=Stylonychia lemnae TaxID=5949 RepID=A0A078AAH9_STYLE|nr:UNKNOWN [Stylonychia lemnae]|eukprot:CDW79280.1 UNKNOWN [Stylonychia lemnae]